MRISERHSYTQIDHWRKYQCFLPDRIRLTAGREPTEEWWAWRGAEIHLDRYAAPAAPLTVVLLHGAGGHSRLVAPYGLLLREHGYVRARIANDLNLAQPIRKLDDLVRAFRRLDEQSRQLLQRQHFTGQMLEQLLSCMRRLAGMADFADELRAAGVAFDEWDADLHYYAKGATALAFGRTEEAEQHFQALATRRPDSRTAAIGLGTARATRLGPQNPRTEELLRIIWNICTLQRKGREKVNRIERGLYGLCGSIRIKNAASYPH